MKKLLWIGDAACDTGFARSTHSVLETLQRHFEVIVLGINYHGDPHSHPYLIYPAGVKGDPFGVNRVKALARKEQVSLVVIQNDTWNIQPYLQQLEGAYPVAAVLPVDGLNVKGRALNDLQLGVFWTQFGLEEARRGGFSQPATVIPLGVDLKAFQPRDRSVCRKNVLPERLLNGAVSQDIFIVGNVNRNQPRKRLDLTLSYFAEWIKKYAIPDAYLLLHVAPTGDPCFDLRQLAQYYNVADRIILSGYDKSFSAESLTQLYGVMDVGLSTTQGEGWGLTTMEGMACGIPQIVPEWAALAEWTREAVELIPCSEIAVTQKRINTIGAVPDRAKMIVSLQSLYASMAKRSELQHKGLARVSEPRFRWNTIGEQFVAALRTL